MENTERPRYAAKEGCGRFVCFDFLRSLNNSSCKGAMLVLFGSTLVEGVRNEIALMRSSVVEERDFDESLLRSVTVVVKGLRTSVEGTCHSCGDTFATRPEIE